MENTIQCLDLGAARGTVLVGKVAPQIQGLYGVSHLLKTLQIETQNGKHHTVLGFGGCTWHISCWQSGTSDQGLYGVFQLLKTLQVETQNGKHHKVLGFT